MEKELRNLELRINRVIELLQRVKLENTALRKKTESLSRENITLFNKNKQAVTEIKSLMLQLQDELQCQMAKK